MPDPELRKLAPLTLLSTAVPRAGMLTTAQFVAFVLAVVPAGKYSSSALMAEEDDGLNTRASVTNVPTAPVTGTSDSFAGTSCPRISPLPNAVECTLT